MKPFFSIIVPCCNVAKYLRECLDSIVGQSFRDWECIIGVETSDDGTDEIVRGYEARDGRIRVFTGPRSGGCSATRNKGFAAAAGEYVICVDGDDSIAEGSLQHIHDAIAERPGADLYPCAIRVYNELLRREEPLRDNYAPDFCGELTGPQATKAVHMRSRAPCPMMQMTVYRRAYLEERGLRCVEGLRCEDNEFTPRALYLARRVIPLHEPFYFYRIRANSIITAGSKAGALLADRALVLKSLYAFHAKVSREAGFDRSISVLWSEQWLTWPYFFWFSPKAICSLPAKKRRETLSLAFADGFGDFNAMTAVSTLPRKAAAHFLKLFLRRPRLGWISDAFFLCVYYPLVWLRDATRRRARASLRK